MDNLEFNGWKNYATWCCNIWADENRWMHDWHDQAVQHYYETEANTVVTKEGHVHTINPKHQHAIYQFSRWLKNCVEEFFEDEFNGEDCNGFFHDMMQYSLGQIDWMELAEHIMPEEADCIALCNERFGEIEDLPGALSEE